MNRHCVGVKCGWPDCARVEECRHANTSLFGLKPTRGLGDDATLVVCLDCGNTQLSISRVAENNSFNKSFRLTGLEETQ